ncbi:MAG: hypothetical protein ACFCGT_28295 [Sandaracinaceae bacterium]
MSEPDGGAPPDEPPAEERPDRDAADGEPDDAGPPRLELVLRSSGPPPEATPRSAPAAARFPERMLGHIPFDEPGEQLLRSLGRWVLLTGLSALAFGVWTAGRYLVAEVPVAQVVVAILATALGVWLLTASVRFRQVLVTDGRDQHHLINGFGLLRTAIVLKALLLFAVMVLGCFASSVVAALLFL